MCEKDLELRQILDIWMKISIGEVAEIASEEEIGTVTTEDHQMQDHQIDTPITLAQEEDLIQGI